MAVHDPKYTMFKMTIKNKGMVNSCRKNDPWQWPEEAGNQHETHTHGNNQAFMEFSALTYALTHWGRVTHICVSKLNIIGSDNGLPPDRRQAII